MTKMAISHKLDPLDLKLLKLSWPGVSIIIRPGTAALTSLNDLHLSIYSTSLLCGKKVAPICWVIPPASPSWTLVFLILSKRVVFPVSTCPRIQQTGLLNYPSFSSKFLWSSVRPAAFSLFSIFSALIFYCLISS